MSSEQQNPSGSSEQQNPSGSSKSTMEKVQDALVWTATQAAIGMIGGATAVVAGAVLPTTSPAPTPPPADTQG